MELYYKDLISKGTSLERLVDDLMRVVQGANELAEVAGAALDGASREEIKTRLERLKANCQSVKRHTMDTAVAADKVMRQHPYSAAGLAFGAGLLCAVLFRRGRRRS